MEFYKTVAEYEADLDHKRTGEHFRVVAKVLEGPSEGRYYIKYSHTYRPTEKAAEMYYSGSFTGASSAGEAEEKVRMWFEQIADSYEVGIWQKTLVQ